MLRSFVCFSFLLSVQAFAPSLHQRRDVVSLFAGGGFGDAKKKGGGGKKMKKSDKKKVQEKLLEKYGGDIARGTEERINKSMQELPEHLQVASTLYKQVQQWEARVGKMSELARSSLNVQEVRRAELTNEDLQQIYETHNLDDSDIHNLFQKITWDASADAKSARAAMYNMNKDLEKRVDKACTFVVDAVDAAGPNGRVLDVGCGPGVLVPYLTKAGVAPKQIVGTDLSPEMIRNARSQHRGVGFVACDFLKAFDDPDGFDGVIFCSALHDLPDPVSALQKAKSLLRPGGKLVILHAQGSSHVLGQVKANPVMVKRALPSGRELEELNLGLQLLVSPAEPDSKADTDEGYLAVLSN